MADANGRGWAAVGRPYLGASTGTDGGELSSSPAPALQNPHWCFLHGCREAISYSPAATRPSIFWRLLQKWIRETSIDFHLMFSSVQSLNRIQLFETPWTAARQASLSITKSQSLLRLMSIESVMPSSHLILCRPLLLLPSIFPSIRVFSNESALYIRWPKYWSFSFNISPSNEHPGLISFQMDWLDLLAVQGTLKSLLQYHSSKASILRCSAFFIVQLSHPYMTIGKTIALTRWTFVGKVTSLLFNMLSRKVIAFLPRSKHLLISWLQSPSAVILEPSEIKSATVSTISPSICHEVMGPDAMIFIFWMLSFKPTFSLSSFTFIKFFHFYLLHFLP